MPSRTTRIALISDIHGNLPALEAVLAEIRALRPRQIWNLGDMLGYIPFPNEVINMLREKKILSIIGNYDLKVLSFPEKKQKWKKKKTPEKYRAFEWNYDNLSKANRTWLQSLQQQRRIEVDGYRVLLTHGSAASNQEGVCDWTAQRRLRELAALSDADVVVSGHAHRPFSKRVAGTWFINAGSVGRPEGGEKRASYAILDFAPGRLVIDHRLVEYDIHKAAEAVRRTGLPKDFADVVRKGMNLTDLKMLKVDGTPKTLSAHKLIAATLELAHRCSYEEEHTHQVTKLALNIFDQLSSLHKLGDKERLLLRCGSLLHDIGWTAGRAGHHKTAMRLIINDETLPLTQRQRRIVALIARYHRKALPKPTHNHFRCISDKDRRLVCVLAGILRIADGLDRSHRQVVSDIKCTLQGPKLRMCCTATGPAQEEFAAAAKKAALLEEALSVNVEFAGRKA